MLCAVVVLSMLTGVLTSCANAEKEAKYNEALALIESGDYEAAYAVFEALDDYKDSETHLSRFVHFPTVINYDLYDRSGVMTVTLGENNLPVRMVSEGTLGTKDGEYTYDEKGNMLKQSMLFNGERLGYDYTYDANDNMIKAEYTVEGAVTAVHDYIYDENGNLVKEIYTQEGTVVYEANNTYNQEGYFTKRILAYPDMEYVYVYTYNEDGRLTTERYDDSAGGWYVCDYTYGDDGKIEGFVYNDDQEFQYTVKYEYDEEGNRIKEESIYADGTKDVLTREYDDFGNVTKEVNTFADGTVQTVETQFALTYVPIDVPASSRTHLRSIIIITTTLV